jgi:hypothetical protein
MNNLKSFLQTKENQINANLSNGEPTEEQLTGFVRAMSDQMYQIVSQAPPPVKNICLVRISHLLVILSHFSSQDWFNRNGMGCKKTSTNSYC